jgi:protocatechuate 3,4-dioxygenase beta subunit
MTRAKSRRAFLEFWLSGAGALAAGLPLRAQGLDQFTLPGPPCEADATPTPGLPADGTYRAGAPVRTSLLGPGVTGTPLVLTGTVSGVTCGRIAGARLEFWQADARGVYDMQGFRLRGQQATDAEGRFSLRTIVPGAGATRARHLGVHVTVAGKADFWTELFFPDDPGNAADKRFQPALLLKTMRAAQGVNATFDILLAI